MTRYAQTFARLERDAEIAFIPFVMLGDPTPEESLDAIDSLVAGGADMLELGIPFSDPIADGPVIQAASLRAREAGTTPARAWELLAEIRRRHPAVPVGLLVYANLVARGGFYASAARTGVDSVLVADVPTREATPYLEAAHEAGVAPVLIAPPNASEATLDRVAAGSCGYTYVVTRRGVTGDAVTDEGQVARARALSELRARGAAPPVLGFGIATPDHVAAARTAGAAGAISGSAVVRRIEAARHDPEARHHALSRGRGLGVA
ncbi:MAG: tryptophan synthase subunit alpha, partial [Myxococcota bacterium]